MGVSLDTKKAHLTRQHGDLIVVFTWVNDERAMVLIPAYRKGAPWFIVLESASYSWDDEEPGNVAEVVRKSMKACEVLGIDATPHNCRRVAKIVIDGLPDLIRMPSAPPQEFHKTNFGEMHLQANGETIASDTIKVEKEGVSYE